MVRRGSGEVRLEVIESAGASELEAIIDDITLEGTTINTDEWNGYNRVGARQGRVHRTVNHSGPKSTWAIDADGDGLREVHCNTMEGLWTGLRDFLRPFRSVSKWYLDQDVAIFQWAHNLKYILYDIIIIFLFIKPSTDWAPSADLASFTCIKTSRVRVAKGSKGGVDDRRTEIGWSLR